MIAYYTGRCDGLVYYYHPDLGRILARRTPRNRPNLSTQRFTEIAHRLRELNVSSGYKEDLRRYALLARVQIKDSRILNWMNVFYQLFWALSKAYGIDLATISRDQIFSLDLPVTNLARAIEAGLLEPVSGWQEFTNQI